MPPNKKARHFHAGPHFHDSVRSYGVGVETGQSFTGKAVVVIGDTPADIACGQAIGAATVAVATGPYPMDALAAAGADWVFEDLRDTEALLSVLLHDGQKPNGSPCR